MKIFEQPPRDPKKKKTREERLRGEGSPAHEADDALEDSSPTDSRSDEKVIVNEQRENKVVNAPSQTAVNPSGDDIF